jgi:hypothetical protein
MTQERSLIQKRSVKESSVVPGNRLERTLLVRRSTSQPGRLQSERLQIPSRPQPAVPQVQTGTVVKRGEMTLNRTKVQLEVRVNMNCSQCHGSKRPAGSLVSLPRTPPPVSPVGMRLPTVPLSPVGLNQRKVIPQSPVGLRPNLALRLSLTGTAPLNLDPSLTMLANRLTVPPPSMLDMLRQPDSLGSETRQPVRSEHPDIGSVSATSTLAESTMHPPPLPSIAECPTEWPFLSPSPVSVPETDAAPPVREFVSRPPPLPPLPATVS